MMKKVILVITIFNAITSSIYAQSLGDPEFAGPLDELSEDIDEDGRSAPSNKLFSSAAVSTGNRLVPGSMRSHECYVCTNCPKTMANTTYKSCSYSADSSKNNKCVVYSEQYRYMKNPWYIRGCASERGNCMDISRTHSSHGDIVKLNFCHECEGDKCNINDGDRPAATVAAFFVLVVTPLLAKATLS